MIKVFVSDMDGTFLRKDHSYDKEKFERAMNLIKENKQHLVLASGNQWRQIRSFFSGYEKDIYIVGENGAVILKNDEIIGSTHFDNDVLQSLLDYVKKLNVIYLISGVQHSYVLESYPNDLKALIGLYARNIKYVSEYGVSDDPILKIACMCPKEDTLEIIKGLKEHFKDVEIHSSGLGVVDINPLGVSKGRGLAMLLDALGCSFDECMAFGDGGNDISMLEKVAFPIVMGNAPSYMDEFGVRIGTNEEQAVLSTILKELEHHD
jgi:Cof subfamily protein (haloacid dehalogenase superfamily)